MTIQSIQFKKAERKQAKLKLAITGPSGSGKTYSALAMASGLGEKIALLDTENGSASLYADKFKFDVLNMSEPCSTEKYIAAIKAAEEAGYDVLVVDSITHQWLYLLAKKEAIDARGVGSSYTNWATITKEHELFKSAIISSGIHLIYTMRSKQEYSIDKDDKGRTTVKKIGLAPIQRDGLEYEFTTVFDIAIDHTAVASKDRSGLFDGQFFKISKETGKILKGWLNGSQKNESKDNGQTTSVDSKTI